MELALSKYHGAGNDFLIIDLNKTEIELGLLVPNIPHWCHRHKGIGADGVLFLEKGAPASFKILIYNADGSLARMCGNGLRCMALYITTHYQQNGWLEIETCAGKHQVLAQNPELIATEFKDCYSIQTNCTLKNWPYLVDIQHPGVIHAVTFLDNVDALDIEDIGPKLRFHEFFGPSGSNINFVQKLDENHLKIRTYERGVEQETLACATGSAAACFSAHQKYGYSDWNVLVQSNDTLKISIKPKHQSFECMVWGPASLICHATITVSAKQPKLDKVCLI